MALPTTAVGIACSASARTIIVTSDSMVYGTGDNTYNAIGYAAAVPITAVGATPATTSAAIGAVDFGYGAQNGAHVGVYRPSIYDVRAIVPPASMATANISVVVQITGNLLGPQLGPNTVSLRIGSAPNATINTTRVFCAITARLDASTLLCGLTNASVATLANATVPMYVTAQQGNLSVVPTFGVAVLAGNPPAVVTGCSASDRTTLIPTTGGVLVIRGTGFGSTFAAPVVFMNDMIVPATAASATQLYAAIPPGVGGGFTVTVTVNGSLSAPVPRLACFSYQLPSVTSLSSTILTPGRISRSWELTLGLRDRRL